MCEKKYPEARRTSRKKIVVGDTEGLVGRMRNDVNPVTYAQPGVYKTETLAGGAR